MKYTFDNPALLESELANHALLSKYFKTPKILCHDEFSIEYKNIKSPLLSKRLDQKYPISLKPLYAKMLKLTPKKSYPRGGAQLFFIDRQKRLSEILKLDTQKVVPINRYYRPLKLPIKLLEKQLRNSLSYLNNSFSIPSNGDFHERNIFSDYTIIDFEGAGINSILADSATFLFHTLFAGTYFGPKYGKWATFRTKMSLLFNQQIIIKNNLVITKISTTRRYLVKEHIKEYLNKLTLTDDNFKVKISELIAFRLATTFQLQKMTRKDLRATISLATLFLDKELSLEQKLNIFTEG